MTSELPPRGGPEAELPAVPPFRGLVPRPRSHSPESLLCPGLDLEPRRPAPSWAAGNDERWPSWTEIRAGSARTHPAAQWGTARGRNSPGSRQVRLESRRLPAPGTAESGPRQTSVQASGHPGPLPAFPGWPWVLRERTVSPCRESSANLGPPPTQKSSGCPTPLAAMPECPLRGLPPALPGLLWPPARSWAPGHAPEAQPCWNTGLGRGLGTRRRCI